MPNNKDNSEILSKLFEYTLSDDPLLRSAAYRALGNYPKEDSIISCLLNGLEDEDPGVRKTASYTLLSFGYMKPIDCIA